jgi:hypothetical protein
VDKKYKKLIISIVMDAIGMIPIPFLDFIWAPISGFIMTKLYKGTKGKIAGFINLLEEISPFLDVIPTFTLMWIYTNFIDPEEVQNEVDEKEKLP